MHVDQIVERFLAHLGDRRDVTVAGIVDEVVEAVALPRRAQHGFQSFSEDRKSRCVAGIELQGNCLATELFDLSDDSFGFCFAALIGLAVVYFTRSGALPVVITPWLMAAIFLLTVVMCVASAFAAILKVVRIDPVVVFSR